MHLQGYQVAIFLLSNKDRASSGLKKQLEIAERLGITIESTYKASTYNIIIDALFGVGLTRDIIGDYQKLIKQVNSENNIVFSVDIPSGISADNGKVMNQAIKADYTITFGYMKQGLLLYPGIDYGGISPL